MIEFTARKNLKLVVSDRQMEIIVGCLLGDAYIHPRGQIQICQSIKERPYLDWKYKELRSLAYGPPSRVEKFDSRYQKTYIAVRFWLRQYFRPLRKVFYPEGRKIFPVVISEYFTDLSLAVWYMDDGNLFEKRHLKIATDGFDKKSRMWIQKMLFDKFGLKSNFQSSGKMRIPVESLQAFFNFVTPHIHSSMRYKIP